ncbi:hypothetical protein CXG81DRAFT_9083 [Caulochytrium protostelioides]|uniref:HIG1 domain-containing protein n=1 Tax=Caulochytrium protostelioides TaxID=1555241 RepID=A0A4P9XF79_9FUNG|nr:hypothetical protein CXG81DRAFT_9083 [Caulochytrium protostelioides]|eukprot:RKP03790.1 hypothetical protein CXG81DRAFT_9083 [Caulochytrium protostelioides]
MSFLDETIGDRFRRKMSENPFIIPGTVGIVYGMYRMSKTLLAGDSRAFQGAQRVRIGWQAFVLAAFVGGAVYSQTIGATPAALPLPSPPKTAHHPS